MARLIDANEITYYTDEQGFECAYKVDIDNLLTIDPESLRPRGRWKDACYYHDCPLCYECSNCGLKLMYKPNYCPNCGCFMENKNEGKGYKRIKAKSKMEDYGGKNR